MSQPSKTTAYLRHFVKVVEMWECQWNDARKYAAVKRCLDAEFPRRQRHARWNVTQHRILTDLRAGTLFGMIECDVHVPEELRARFAEMQPVFKNVAQTLDDLGPFMRRYAKDHDIKTRPQRILVGSFHGDNILLGTPLLRWYMEHGLVVTRVYQVIEHDSNPWFRRFGDSVSAARRVGDAYPHKTIIADSMKLLRNSGYGKPIANVVRHRGVTYCTEVGASTMINNRRFRQLDVVVDNVERRCLRTVESCVLDRFGYTERC